ncbi:hypothetical protein [Paraburkholderia caledonica]|uniref:hypothetical protein n=1 Tax=Paraburkholderia caledonica TaxID=134536 RepID=UPI003709539A
MFAFGGMGAASRFILVARRTADLRILKAAVGAAAMQWHASRSWFARAKSIDLAELIVYNLSNWTGLRKRDVHQG